MTIGPRLRPFDQLVGTWTTEATHPKMPGVIVHGTAVIEWLEGKQFLIVRAHTDHPHFPGSIFVGLSQLREDDVHCTDDLSIT